jgi:hypothetical protein
MVEVEGLPGKTATVRRNPTTGRTEPTREEDE